MSSAPGLKGAKAIDITIGPSDALRLSQEILKGLKGLFSFEKARFLPFQRKDELLAILKDIPMSSRQKERAEKTLLRQDGFWDRVGQRALIPLISREEGLWLGLFEFSAIPKDVSPDEAERTLRLLETTLHDKIVLAKLLKTSSVEDRPPPYILDILKDKSSQGLHVIQLSFFRKIPGPERNEKCITDLFHNANIEFAGRSCSTLWYVVSQQRDSAFSNRIRQLAILLTRLRQPFRAILGHTILRDLTELAHIQHVARGLKSAVLMPSALEEILMKTGADLKNQVFGPKRPLVGSGDWCCIMASIESLAAGKRIKEAFLHKETACQILQVGTRCMMLHFRGLQFNKEASLVKWSRAIFKEISRAARSRVTVGIACSSQPFVSRKSLPFSALLALFHAHLLGKGKMALFDHVTCNVHGDLLLSWGDIKGACRAYRTGLKLHPSDTNLLNSLGVCLADLKRTREAQDCFHKVLASAPDNFMALYNLSGINLDSGNLEEAEKQAQRAYSMDKHNPAILIRLANCWIRQKRYGQILQMLLPEIQEKSSPPTLSLLRICGRAALETGDWKKAKMLIGRCLNRQKNDPLCLALMAKGYYTYEQDQETALRFLKRIPAEAVHSGAIKEIIRDLKQITTLKGQV